MYLKLAWRNIWRNKKRTAITVASIGFAVFFACVMQSFQLGSYDRMIDNTVRFSTGHIQIHDNGYWEEKIIDKSFEPNEKIDQAINNLENVELTAPRLESFALAAYKNSTRGVLVMGVDPKKELAMNHLDEKITAGQYFQNDDAVLVGEGLADYLDIDIGDTLVMIGQGFRGINAAGKYPVDGILKFPIPEMNKSAVFMPLETAQYFYGATNRLTSISILVDQEDNVKPSLQNLRAALDTEAYDIMSWREMMPELVQSIELDYYGGLIMIFILYGVIAFGIFGTFLMMAKERAYEFGILIAIGMKKIKLQLMVALEVIVMAFLGVLSGVVASLPVLVYMYFNPIQVTGKMAESLEKFGLEPILPFSMAPSIFGQQAVIILIITLILGAYPLHAIGSTVIVKALRE